MLFRISLRRRVLIVRVHVQCLLRSGHYVSSFAPDAHSLMHEWLSSLKVRRSCPDRLINLALISIRLLCAFMHPTEQISGSNEFSLNFRAPQYANAGR